MTFDLCIRVTLIYTFQMTFSLKPLSQLYPYFLIVAYRGCGEWKFIQMVPPSERDGCCSHIWWKPFENILQTQETEDHDTCNKASGTKPTKFVQILIHLSNEKPFWVRTAKICSAGFCLLTFMVKVLWKPSLEDCWHSHFQKHSSPGTVKQSL